TLADGALEAEFALKKEADAAQQASKASGEAAASASALAGTGGIPGGGLGAVLGVGAALAPVVPTLGFGCAGLGLAAAGGAKPIEAAAQKAGGLRANLAGLDSQQQTVATGIMGLGKSYSSFEHALEPVLVKDFTSALGLVAPLLHGIE